MKKYEKVPLEKNAESNRWTSSEDPQRSVKVFSDHAVQIASNKTHSWWKQE